MSTLYTYILHMVWIYVGGILLWVLYCMVKSVDGYTTNVLNIYYVSANLSTLAARTRTRIHRYTDILHTVYGSLHLLTVSLTGGVRARVGDSPTLVIQIKIIK